MALVRLTTELGGGQERQPALPASANDSRAEGARHIRWWTSGVAVSAATNMTRQGWTPSVLSPTFMPSARSAKFISGPCLSGMPTSSRLPCRRRHVSKSSSGPPLTDLSTIAAGHTASTCRHDDGSRMPAQRDHTGHAASPTAHGLRAPGNAHSMRVRCEANDRCVVCEHACGRHTCQCNPCAWPRGGTGAVLCRRVDSHWLRHLWTQPDRRGERTSTRGGCVLLRTNGGGAGDLPLDGEAQLIRVTTTAPSSTAPSCRTHWVWRSTALGRLYATMVCTVTQNLHRLACARLHCPFEHPSIGTPTMLDYTTCVSGCRSRVSMSQCMEALRSPTGVNWSQPTANSHTMSSMPIAIMFSISRFPSFASLAEAPKPPAAAKRAAAAMACSKPRRHRSYNGARQTARPVVAIPSAGRLLSRW